MEKMKILVLMAVTPCLILSQAHAITRAAAATQASKKYAAARPALSKKSRRLAEVATHPLDPLTRDEIAAARTALIAWKSFPAAALFPMVALHEPPKEEVLAFRPGTSFRREAYAAILDRPANKVYEAIVDVRDVKAAKVLSWKEVTTGGQPPVLNGEFDEVPALIKADPRWQAAVRKRGFDPSKCYIDTWARGDDRTLPEGAQKDHRILRGVSYYKGDSKYIYARPIEGLHAVVDMTTKTVLDVQDRIGDPMPMSGDDGAFDRATLESHGMKFRSDIKPIRITQPEGVNFEVNGHEVVWQKWHFRFSMHPREGLVLHQVGYEDQGKIRPILYRASVSETVVPYGDPDKGWEWRAAFDIGEYGFGKVISPLIPKVDVPENAQFYDAQFATDTGEPDDVVQNALAIYERDGGILWKHADFIEKYNEVRRSTELVITFFTAISNYDYGFSWIFHQDGTLEFQTQLTGVMEPKGVKTVVAQGGHHDASNPDEQFGHLVTENVVAPHHQHFFNFRLDFDVDGTDNSLVEINTRQLDKGNPYGNGLLMEESQLKTEQAAQRDMNMESNRRWVVVNPNVKNALGHSTGYALVPEDNSVSYLADNSPLRKRAGFLNHQIWATQYAPEEMNAAGAFPNQSSGGEGLPSWTSSNRSIDGKDLVLWYTMGITHLPRPEEWPVMAIASNGFKIVPVGFFSKNPALDVPAPVTK